MANAKICDRCGVYYTPNANNHRYTVTKRIDLINGAFDLCEKCSESLDAWVINGKEAPDVDQNTK